MYSEYEYDYHNTYEISQQIINNVSDKWINYFNSIIYILFIIIDLFFIFDNDFQESLKICIYLHIFHSSVSFLLNILQIYEYVNQKNLFEKLLLLVYIAWWFYTTVLFSTTKYEDISPELRSVMFIWTILGSLLFLLRIIPKQLTNMSSRLLEIINNLKTIPYSQGRLQYFSTDCCICLETYVDNEQIKILPCEHGFHPNCIDEWLVVDSRCPLCKIDLMV